MKRKNSALFRTVLFLCLIVSLLLSPVVSFAGAVGPEVRCAKASPCILNLGAQPEGSPVLLSVEGGGPGGQITSVAVNLSGLIGARYYDPLADAVEQVGSETAMLRVYEIEGEEAYLVETGSRHEYNVYRKASTHEKVRGTAMATNKWQVELPHVGNRQASFSLRVIAVNIINQEGIAWISLDVVDDSTSPEVKANAKFLINSPVTRAGDRVGIEATITDDLSGVFAARLVGEGAKSVFGEHPNLKMERQPDTDSWRVENTLAQTILPGIYTIEVAAIDRAGNETIQPVKIKVADAISSFRIELRKGWNLLSVPKALKDASVSEVFAGLPVKSVRAMVSGQWLEVNEIRPGMGYLVEATADSTLEVWFSEADYSIIPLIIELGPGWNLVGCASRTMEPILPLTFYLGDDLKDEWLILYNEDGEQARPKATSPYIWATDGFPTVTGEPFSENNSENVPGVEPGKGYWLYLTGEGVLVP